MSLRKSTRVPTFSGWKRPVRFWQMTTLLTRFGLPKMATDKSHHHRVVFAGHRKNPYALWDEVRSHWRRVRRSLHPDAGGCAKRFANTSAIYDEIEKRLKRQGIET